MRFFKRRCRSCGTSADQVKVGELKGTHGEAEVEFHNFPYQACSCGKLARWAFDPGLEFSKQLFYEGVPSAEGGTEYPRCARCDAELGARQPVQLERDVRLEGFAPIGFRIRLNGYRCESCGLEQATTNPLEDGNGARAFREAFRSIGLESY